ncbi:MAG: serine/threonine-protein kinase, partial [Anaerolineae bacterium]
MYDCDEVTLAGQPLLYIASEFTEGSTLKEKLAVWKASNQIMPLTEIAALMKATASALDYAHARGVVHSGLKPDNILFTAQGEPALTDFSIASAIKVASQTLPADPSGAPAYMAPEQVRGDPIDNRADIYALGVLLYELCTNTPPFTTDTAVGV